MLKNGKTRGKKNKIGSPYLKHGVPILLQCTESFPSNSTRPRSTDKQSCFGGGPTWNIANIAHQGKTLDLSPIKLVRRPARQSVSRASRPTQLLTLHRRGWEGRVVSLDSDLLPPFLSMQPDRPSLMCRRASRPGNRQVNLALFKQNSSSRFVLK